VGSHKPNSAVPQAYYNKREGVKRLTTETGAGQWGSALSLATSKFGLECKVYMVRVSYDQKPYRKFIMQAYGGEVVASPSMDTKTGREILARDPNTPGALGMAISEALEDASSRDDTNYALGSVLNHVVLHQSIIGLEAKKQMEIAGEYPDVVIGCCGGGSNFAGLMAPFVPDYLDGKKIEFIGYEPASCPSMTGGKLAYDCGDVAMMTPLLPMHSLGHQFVPEPIHAGGLRYHGMAPLVCQAIVEGLFRPRSYHQRKCYESALTWAKTEGMICAPETSHAVAATIDEAIKAREEGKEKVILFSYSGHGLMDLSGYDKYMSGKLSDYELPDEVLQQCTKDLEKMPKAPARKTGRW